MAIYRLEVKPVSRGGGRSIVAAAAYRSGQELVNPRDGLVHDYTRRHGVEHSELVGWDGTRQELWGRTEEVETRKNARLGVETIVSLPHELSAEDRRALTASFAQELSAAYRAPVDFSIHAPHDKGDERNHHAHVLVGCRRSDGRELGERVVPFDGPEEVERWRGRWAELCNERLRDRGLEQRVDHRSLAAQRAEALERGEERKAQDLDRAPQPKVGPTATAMERRGVQTDRGDRQREVLAQNAERQSLWRRIREWGQQLGERAQALRDDVTERAKAAFGRGQESAAGGEAGAAKPASPVDLVEQAKAAGRQELGERAQASRDDVTERAKAAPELGQEPAASAKATPAKPFSLSPADLVEQAKARGRQALEAKRTAEAMRPFEARAQGFADMADGFARSEARTGRAPTQIRAGVPIPEAVQKGFRDFNRLDDAGKAAFKADLAGGLATAGGVTPPKPPSVGAMGLVGPLGVFMMAVNRATRQVEQEAPAPVLGRTSARDRDRGPSR